MAEAFYKILEDCPVIAAVKNEQGLDKALKTECPIIFILFGDVCNVGQFVQKGKDAGKTVLVHLDLIAGLGSKEVAVDFIKKHTCADGIISTKPGMLKRAKELDMLTVMRFFVLDSMALESIERQWRLVKPDAVEVLPGVMPKVIRRICRQVPGPVIAGGLISDKEDILNALDAGAISISTTNQEVWFL